VKRVVYPIARDGKMPERTLQDVAQRKNGFRTRRASSRWDLGR
jgi:hypothetical protein